MYQKDLVRSGPRRVQWSRNVARGGAAALCAVLTVGAAACSSSGGSSASGGTSSSASYTVPIITPLTGNQSSQDAPSGAGVQAAFNTINASGGINGHMIKFTVLDDESSTARAAAVGAQALQSQPTAIVDASGTSLIGARIPAYLSAKIPVMATDNISYGPYPWLYGPVTTPAQGTHVLVGAAAAVLKASSLSGRRVALVTISTSTAQATDEANAIKSQGGTVVASEFQPVGSASFAAGASRVVAANADVALLVDTVSDVVVEAKALLAAGFKGPMVTTAAASDDVTFKTIDSPQFYGLRFMRVAVPGTEDYAAAQKYSLLSEAGGSYYGLGWSAAYSLAAGLKACGYPCSPDALEKALNGLGQYTPPGNVTFGPLQFTASVHNDITAEQLYQWDPAKGTGVEFGGIVSVGSPDYAS